MASKDLHDNILSKNGCNGGTISSATTTTGVIIDTQFFEAIEFILRVDAWSVGTASIHLEDGNDPALADAAAVDPTFELGTEANTAIAAANTTSRIGYSGKKRYVRADIVTVGGSVSLYAGISAILGFPHTAPTDADITV